VRCGRCGNENDEANRFCGMCGSSLVVTVQSTGQSAPAGNVAPAGQAAVRVPPLPVQSAPKHAVEEPLASPAGLTSPTAERRAAPLRPEVRPEVRSEFRPSAGPVITGHSFLGLSTPGPAVDHHAEHDALRPSSNLDYLLEDEEEPKRRWGKPILIVVALGLAMGFGYLHWKQGGFDWLNAGDKKLAAAVKQPADALQSPDSGGATGAATPGASAPAAGTSDTGTTPAAGGATASPGEPAAGQVNPPQANSQAPVPAAPPQTAPSPASPAQTQPAQTQPADPNLPTAPAPAPAGSDADKQTPPAAPPPEPKAAARKPSPAKVVAAKAVDPVTEAERYIYGRGVRQDCDHGLRLVKPAAEQSNTKAMISLGALYSTGTCTPRDLPTAYRWFALALHKEPDNQALQDDLQKLWSQMTQPERQLAIKLSQ
jgi:hypothetical protein